MADAAEATAWRRFKRNLRAAPRGLPAARGKRCEQPPPELPERYILRLPALPGRGHDDGPHGISAVLTAAPPPPAPCEEGPQPDFSALRQLVTGDPGETWFVRTPLQRHQAQGGAPTTGSDRTGAAASFSTLDGTAHSWPTLDATDRRVSFSETQKSSAAATSVTTTTATTAGTNPCIDASLRLSLDATDKSKVSSVPDGKLESSLTSSFLGRSSDGRRKSGGDNQQPSKRPTLERDLPPAAPSSKSAAAPPAARAGGLPARLQAHVLSALAPQPGDGGDDGGPGSQTVSLAPYAALRASAASSPAAGDSPQALSVRSLTLMATDPSVPWHVSFVLLAAFLAEICASAGDTTSLAHLVLYILRERVPKCWLPSAVDVLASSFLAPDFQRIVDCGSAQESGDRGTGAPEESVSAVESQQAQGDARDATPRDRRAATTEALGPQSAPRRKLAGYESGEPDSAEGGRRASAQPAKCNGAPSTARAGHSLGEPSAGPRQCAESASNVQTPGKDHRARAPEAGHDGVQTTVHPSGPAGDERSTDTCEREATPPAMLPAGANADEPPSAGASAARPGRDAGGLSVGLTEQTEAAPAHCPAVGAAPRQPQRSCPAAALCAAAVLFAGLTTAAGDAAAESFTAKLVEFILRRAAAESGDFAAKAVLYALDRIASVRGFPAVWTAVVEHGGDALVFEALRLRAHGEADAPTREKAVGALMRVAVHLGWTDEFLSAAFGGGVPDAAWPASIEEALLAGGGGCPPGVVAVAAGCVLGCGDAVRLLREAQGHEGWRGRQCKIDEALVLLCTMQQAAEAHSASAQSIVQVLRSRGDAAAQGATRATKRRPSGSSRGHNSRRASFSSQAHTNVPPSLPTPNSFRGIPPSVHLLHEAESQPQVPSSQEAGISRARYVVDAFRCLLDDPEVHVLLAPSARPGEGVVSDWCFVYDPEDPPACTLCGDTCAGELRSFARPCGHVYHEACAATAACPVCAVPQGTWSGNKTRGPARELAEVPPGFGRATLIVEG
ncbi:hypothetical protein DIPPA_21171 [Diplonema papillatum]|nr:hypothetical protein DIPPA_21171 [Diplonema papillatum]